MRNIILDTYVKEGRLSNRKAVVGGQEYELFCYTKDQFFNHPWDLITINHRGRIYRDGRLINEPFAKVFNLGEHPSTNPADVVCRMWEEEFEVLDKVNGHLVIASPDLEMGNVIVHTKGSLGGELGDQATDLARTIGIQKCMIENGINMTLMFEALVSWDKHALYDEQVSRYGGEKDQLILLGAIEHGTLRSWSHEALVDLAALLGVPVVSRRKDIEQAFKDDANFNIEKLKDDLGIEGYIIHFPASGFRAKIKTHEYLRLRYLKDINPVKVISKFVKSGRVEMFRSMDEELHEITKAVMVDFYDYMMTQVDAASIGREWFDQHRTKREIFQDQKLTQLQKLWLTSVDCHDIFDRKQNRAGFFQSGQWPHTNRAVAEFLVNMT